jgi:hypothetical protein
VACARPFAPDDNPPPVRHQPSATSSPGPDVER